MSKNVLVIGTGTIGEPLIGLLADHKDSLGLDNVIFFKRTPLSDERGKVESLIRKGAKIVKEVNKEVAAIIGINPAARTTCVKPSGNASVLLQTASGIHAEHSKMYIRNVQMTKESEISQALLKSNPYMVEDSVWSAGGTDYVISFPILPKKGSIYKDDLLGVKHLELVKKAQQNWVVAGTNEDLCADKGLRHNVSNTIIVDDWSEVENYVFKNRNYFAGISFLPMTGDKDYNQAPNTAVIDAKQMVKEYGTGAIFASGMVVDSLKALLDFVSAHNPSCGLNKFSFRNLSDSSVFP